MPGDTRNQRQDNGDCDQNNDDPLQNFHALIRGVIGDFCIDALQGAQLAHDTGIPLFEMKPLRCQPIHPRQVLIAEQLEGIVYPFKEHSAIDLHLPHAMQVGGGRTRAPWPAPGTSGQGFVCLVQGIVELLVQIAHLQEFDVGEFQHGAYVVCLTIAQQGGMPIDDGHIVQTEGKAMGDGVVDFLVGERGGFDAQDLGHFLGIRSIQLGGTARAGEASI